MKQESQHEGAAYVEPGGRYRAYPLNPYARSYFTRVEVSDAIRDLVCQFRGVEKVDNHGRYEIHVHRAARFEWAEIEAELLPLIAALEATDAR